MEGKKGKSRVNPKHFAPARCFFHAQKSRRVMRIESILRGQALAHMTEPPEGFLVCHSVPICRTGTQKYLPSEIGEKGSGLVGVSRNDDEVFKPAAMASFEGKQVTDDHPSNEVYSSNYGAYTSCPPKAGRGIKVLGIRKSTLRFAGCFGISMWRGCPGIRAPRPNTGLRHFLCQAPPFQHI